MIKPALLPGPGFMPIWCGGLPLRGSLDCCPTIPVPQLVTWMKIAPLVRSVWSVSHCGCGWHGTNAGAAMDSSIPLGQGGASPGLFCVARNEGAALGIPETVELANRILYPGQGQPPDGFAVGWGPWESWALRLHWTFEDQGFTGRASAVIDVLRQIIPTTEYPEPNRGYQACESPAVFDGQYWQHGLGEAEIPAWLCLVPYLAEYRDDLPAWSWQHRGRGLVQYYVRALVSDLAALKEALRFYPVSPLISVRADVYFPVQDLSWRSAMMEGGYLPAFGEARAVIGGASSRILLAQPPECPFVAHACRSEGSGGSFGWWWDEDGWAANRTWHFCNVHPSRVLPPWYDTGWDLAVLYPAP